MLLLKLALVFEKGTSSGQMNTAETPVPGFAGLPASTILAGNSARAQSLRTVTPFSHGLTWVGTFGGIAVSAFVLTELCPPEFDFLLIALGIYSVLMGVLSVLVGRFAPERFRYPLFRLSTFAGLLLFAAIYGLSPQAIPVVLVVSIGFPLQVSHFLTRRDLEIAIVTWTVISIAALVFGLTGPLAVDEVVPIFIAVVPITWIVSAICFRLSETRFAAIDAANIQALRDSQSGIANRRGLAEVGGAMLREGRVAGLLLIDLDDFKSANTLHGHLGGDHVIAEVSDELLRRCGEDDLPVRLGGDEFVVVISRMRGKSLAEEQHAYERAIAQLNEHIEMPGFRLSASTGVAVFGVDGREIDELLASAEERLTEAKRLAVHTAPGPAPVDAPVQDATPLGVPAAVLLEQAASAPDVAVLRRSTALLISALVLFASLPFIEATAYERIAVALIAASMLIGVALHRGMAIGAPSWLARASGYAAYPLIAVLALLTGGADGPALPLLFILIAYDARDDGPGALGVKFVLAELVAISPLIYLEGTSVEEATAIGVMVAVSVMAPIVLGLMVRFRSQIEAARARASELARRDELTGVLNRRAFEQAATAAIASGERCAIVMIDLDNFKTVNTEDGYAGGDKVLAAIGSELTSATRSLDVIARVGGDEFAALLREVGSIDLTEAAGRFMFAVDTAVASQGSSAARRVTASCGIAVHPDHGDDLGILMQAADAALMHVKHSGKSAARLQPTT